MSFRFNAGELYYTTVSIISIGQPLGNGEFLKFDTMTTWDAATSERCQGLDQHLKRNEAQRIQIDALRRETLSPSHRKTASYSVSIPERGEDQHRRPCREDYAFGPASRKQAEPPGNGATDLERRRTAIRERRQASYMCQLCMIIAGCQSGCGFSMRTLTTFSISRYNSFMSPYSNHRRVEMQHSATMMRCIWFKGEVGCKH